MNTMSQWMAFLIVAKSAWLEGLFQLFSLQMPASLSQCCAPLCSQYSHVKQWVKEADWKMAKRETFSSYLTFKRQKGIDTQEWRVMLVLLYALKAFAGHIAKGNRRKTEEFEKKKTLKTYVTSDTSPLINRHFSGSGSNLLCENFPAPTHSIFL